MLTARIRNVMNIGNIQSALTPSRPSFVSESNTSGDASSATSPDVSQTILGDTILESPLETRDPLDPTLSDLHPRVVHPPPEDPKTEPHAELPRMRGETFMLEVDGKPVEIKSQIQLYAM